jgi:steroid 5-alpha reductase family enzyme
VQRPFVESTLGLLALLPVRVVLWAIRLAEDAAGRTFELSANHRWIAFAAAVVGASIVGFAAFGARALVRRFRASTATVQPSVRSIDG